MLIKSMAPLLTKMQKAGVALLVASATVRNKRRKKRYWSKKMYLLRTELSPMNVLKNSESEDFLNFLKMKSECFDELLNLVTPYIKKQDTHMRKSISPKERLVVTLRFLATGQCYEDLKFSANISPQTLSKIIPETCWGIYKCLKHYIKMPTTQAEWKQNAKEFEEKWHFNHCLGAIDGKHIAIEKPSGSDSVFYNYKHFFSIVLLAVVNANYEFIYVNTGTNGGVSDGEVLKSTSFYQKIMGDELNLPPPSNLPNTDTPAPYVFVTDSAFAINGHIMKPFPFDNITHEKRIFNYRLSRARRIAENSFGILAARFGIFHRSIGVKIENVDPIVLACCALHNFLLKKSTGYITDALVDHENIESTLFLQGEWRQATDGLVPLAESTEKSQNEEGNNVRNTFTQYFNCEGSVNFQEKMTSLVPMQ